MTISGKGLGQTNGCVLDTEPVSDFPELQTDLTGRWWSWSKVLYQLSYHVVHLIPISHNQCSLQTSKLYLIINYIQFPAQFPHSSVSCSRRMNEENVPLTAHHQETVPGPHPPPDRPGGEAGGVGGEGEGDEGLMCDSCPGLCPGSCPPPLSPASGLCDRAV